MSEPAVNLENPNSQPDGVGSVEQSYVGARAQGGGSRPRRSIRAGGGNAPAPIARPRRSLRGRPPLPPEEKAARANQWKREKAGAKARKETSPKPLTSARDAAVNALAEFVAANIGNLPDLVQIISGYAA